MKGESDEQRDEDRQPDPGVEPGDPAGPDRGRGAARKGRGDLPGPEEDEGWRVLQDGQVSQVAQPRMEGRMMTGETRNWVEDLPQPKEALSDEQAAQAQQFAAADLA